MHDEARRWIETVLAKLPPPELVVEIGSRDINGGIRDLFACAYIGVDLNDGPGVDIVGDATLIDLPEADMVVTTETLEHYPNPQAVIDAAFRALRPGGVLIATMAGPGRIPHSGLCEGPPEPGEHYQNIHPGDLKEWLGVFAEHDVNVAGADVRCWARKGD